MPMRPCEKCLENNWSFQKIENIIRATCKMCGHEVEFETKKQSDNELKVGAPCRKCKTKLILKEPRKHKTSAAFYYSAYYFCPNCKTMYMSEKFKVWREGEKEEISGLIGEGKTDILTKLVFYCDAGTQNNGQFGNQKTVVVVTDAAGKVLVEEWVGDKTNNEGELIAIMKARGIAPSGSTIFSDSKLAVNWVNKRYKTRIDRLKSLISEVVSSFKESGVEVKWTPREQNRAGMYIEEKHSL